MQGFTHSCSDESRGLRVTHFAVTCDHQTDPERCDPLGRLRAPVIDRRQDCRGVFFAEYARTRPSTVQTSSGPHYYVYPGDRNEIMRPRVWYVCCVV